MVSDHIVLSDMHNISYMPLISTVGSIYLIGLISVLLSCPRFHYTRSRYTCVGAMDKGRTIAYIVSLIGWKGSFGSVRDMLCNMHVSSSSKLLCEWILYST